MQKLRREIQVVSILVIILNTPSIGGASTSSTPNGTPSVLISKRVVQTITLSY